MYSRIVVGHNLEEGGRDALALARRLGEVSGAELVVGGVFPFGAAVRYGFAEHWEKDEVQTARELEEAAAGVGGRAEGFPSVSPARGLHDLAVEVGADLIVVGSSHRGRVGQVLAGNVATGLLHGAPCAVAVAPLGYRDQSAPIGTLVVGYDGTAESDLALADAFELAARGGQTVKVVAVAEPPALVYGKGAGAMTGWHELVGEVEKLMRSRVDEACRRAPEGVRAEGVVLSGEPAEQLSEAASAEGSLLLLGSRGYGPIRHVLIGSVASAIARSAPCPILVHPRGAAEA